MSYSDAVSVSPSSPGADQVSVIELGVGLPAARSVTAAGGVVSGGGPAGFRARLAVFGEPNSASMPVWIAST